MIVKIILLVLWIIVALLEGTRDGFFFAYRMQSKPDRFNMHWLFTSERTIVLVLIAWIYSRTYSFLDTGVFTFSLILLFSFLHNGMYYKIRHMLDKNIYPKGWWDSSTTSESMIEFSIVSRTFLAIVGSVGIITSLTF